MRRIRGLPHGQRGDQHDGGESATAQGLVAYRTQEMDLESLYFLGNQNQTGMTLDGTGNYTGGTFFDNEFSGFQIAVNAIGHQIANPATPSVNRSFATMEAEATSAPTPTVSDVCNATGRARRSGRQRWSSLPDERR